MMDKNTSDVLKLTVTDLANIFDPVIESTLKLVEDQLERSIKALTRSRALSKKGVSTTCKIDKMFFVGGLSASNYLWKKAQDRFKNRVQMFRPSDPGSAVVKGAVMWGKFPRYIIDYL